MKLVYHTIGAIIVFSAVLFAQPASAKCVSRTIVDASGTSQNIVAVVPDSGSPDLTAAGYQDASCGVIDKAANLARVCNTRAWGNDGVRRQLEIQAGISFAQLCTAARLEAGLSATPPDPTAGRYSPSNQSQPIQSSSAPIVGLLSAPTSTASQTGGN